MSTYPFDPDRGANQVLTAGATSLNTALNTGSPSVRICNISANIAHVRIGIGAQTATTADVPIPPTSQVILRKDDAENNIGYISASGATLHVQTGRWGV